MGQLASPNFIPTIDSRPGGSPKSAIFNPPEKKEPKEAEQVSDCRTAIPASYGSLYKN
jgi:hypothetical protein